MRHAGKQTKGKEQLVNWNKQCTQTKSAQQKVNEAEELRKSDSAIMIQQNGIHKKVSWREQFFSYFKKKKRG